MHCGPCDPSSEESMICMRAVCCPPRKKNREKEMRIKVPLFHLIGRQQAISVLGSVIKQCCGKITRADQTAHEANGKSRHGYALALVSSHDVYFFVFFLLLRLCRLVHGLSSRTMCPTWAWALFSLASGLGPAKANITKVQQQIWSFYKQQNNNNSCQYSCNENKNII